MKSKLIFVGAVLLALSSQTFAKKVDNPLLSCYEFGTIADMVITYRMSGVDQAKMVRTMKKTGEDPQHEIRANVGLKLIEKAYAVEVPKDLDAQRKEITKFIKEQKQYCDDVLKIEVD